MENAGSSPAEGTDKTLKTMDKFEYFGLFLNSKTRDRLLKTLKSSPYNTILDTADRIFLDHCTLLHKSQSCTKDILDYLNDRIGKKFIITITGIGVSDKAMAFKVHRDIYCANRISHITIATFKRGKPKDSNDILLWTPIKPIGIETTLDKV